MTELYPELGVRLTLLVIMFFLLSILAVLLYFKIKEGDKKGGLG